MMKKKKVAAYELYATWEQGDFFNSFPCVLLLTDSDNRPVVSGAFSCGGLETLGDVLAEVVFDFFDEAALVGAPQFIGRLFDRHITYNLEARLVQTSCSTCQHVTGKYLLVQVLQPLGHGKYETVSNIQVKVPEKVE